MEHADTLRQVRIAFDFETLSYIITIRIPAEQLSFIKSPKKIYKKGG